MSVNIQGRKRYFYIDVLRVLCSFMVIFTHVIMYRVNIFPIRSTSWTGMVLGKAITQFAVPCFFMISGAMLLSDSREMRYGEFIKRRFGKVFLPFLLWTVLYYIYFYFLMENRSLSLMGYAKDFVGQNISGHFWYMYALAACYLLIPFMQKLVKSLSRTELRNLILVLVGLGTLLPFADILLATFTAVNPSLFEVSKLGVYLNYMLTGYYLHTLSEEENGKLVRCCIPVILAVMLFQTGMTWYASTEKFSTDWIEITYVPVFLYAMAVFVLVRRIFEKMEVQKTRFCKWIGSLSGLSFTAYLLHMLVLRTDQYFMTNYKLKIHFLDTPIVLAGIILGEMLCAVLLSYILAAAVRRIKWIGKYL